ncbi:hypothetical protein PR048_001874 [Dryococelus australis]|uniref:HTH psq-type domain-containing protein n=1 Tax=Dryococelus australis TaxID=614101 RepID=A0ABQ9IK24_9NEOP|nr:hypothetical protein PR048_001874 [Dryococelus australis]
MCERAPIGASKHVPKFLDDIRMVGVSGFTWKIKGAANSMVKAWMEEKQSYWHRIMRSGVGAKRAAPPPLPDKSFQLNFSKQFCRLPEIVLFTKMEANGKVSPGKSILMQARGETEGAVQIGYAQQSFMGKLQATLMPDASCHDLKQYCLRALKLCFGNLVPRWRCDSGTVHNIGQFCRTSTGPALALTSQQGKPIRIQNGTDQHRTSNPPVHVAGPYEVANFTNGKFLCFDDNEGCIRYFSNTIHLWKHIRQAPCKSSLNQPPLAANTTTKSTDRSNSNTDNYDNNDCPNCSGGHVETSESHGETSKDFDGTSEDFGETSENYSETTSAHKNVLSLHATVVRNMCNLRANSSVTGKVLKDVISETEALLCETVKHLKRNVKEFFAARSMLRDDDVQDLMLCFDLENPFEGLSTTDRQIAALKETFNYIEPIEIPLCHHIDSVPGSKIGKQKVKHVYETCQYMPSPSIAGVTADSALHKSKYFDMTSNYVFYIMHDMLEGICQFELKQVIHQYIFFQALFSVELLNARINSFRYGIPEGKNKPSAYFSASSLRNMKDHSIKQKAMQTCYPPDEAKKEVAIQLVREFPILKDVSDATGEGYLHEAAAPKFLSWFGAFFVPRLLKMVETERPDLFRKLADASFHMLIVNITRGWQNVIVKVASSSNAGAGKRKAIDVNTKFEIVKACEEGSVSKTEVCRHFGFSSSTLFTILKNKDKIKDVGIKHKH